MSNLTKRLSELRENGTQGEWKINYEYHGNNCKKYGCDCWHGIVCGDKSIIGNYDYKNGGVCSSENDAQLIVETINALPKLLEIIRVQGEALKQYAEHMESINDGPDAHRWLFDDEGQIAKEALQETRRIEDE